jgi:hypothetical protein
MNNFKITSHGNPGAGAPATIAHAKRAELAEQAAQVCNRDLVLIKSEQDSIKLQTDCKEVVICDAAGAHLVSEQPAAPTLDVGSDFTNPLVVGTDTAGIITVTRVAGGSSGRSFRLNFVTISLKNTITS